MKRFILFMLLGTSLLLSCSQATYEEMPVSADGNDMIILWDWQSRKRVKQIEDFDVVTYSPDGSYIAAGSYEGKVVLWDSNGNFLKEVDILPHSVGTISFSADSQKIVTADRVTGEARVYSIPEGEKLTVFTQHTNEVFVTAFHENHTFATAGFDPEDLGQIRSYTFTNDGNVVVGNFFTLNLHQNKSTL